MKQNNFAFVENRHEWKKMKSENGGCGGSWCSTRMVMPRNTEIRQTMMKGNQGTSAEVVVVGTVAGATKCCKCGSTKHKRTSHKDCPLKKTTSEHQ